MIHIRTTAARYIPGNELTGGREVQQPGQWLDVIHAANRIDPTMFGQPMPESGPWWAGGSVEEYPNARVIHRSDSPTVSVVAKTEHGDQVLRQAAEQLGIQSSELIGLVAATAVVEEDDQ